MSDGDDGMLQDEIPEFYHFRNNIRIPPALGVVDVGWTVLRDNETAVCERRTILLGTQSECVMACCAWHISALCHGRHARIRPT